MESAFRQAKQKKRKPIDVSELVAVIGNEETSERLWAISQLPLIGYENSNEIEVKCFQIIRNSMEVDNPAFMSELSMAIKRESQIPAMKVEDYARTVVPILIDCINDEIAGNWSELLRNSCRLMKTPESQSLMLELLSQLLADSSFYSTQCTIQIANGLCDAGIPLPQNIFNQLLSRPLILQECLSPILSSVSANHPPSFIQAVYDSVTKLIPDDSAIADAALQMPHIPSKVLDSLTNMIRSSILRPSMETVVSKRRDRVSQLGILPYKEVFRCLWDTALRYPSFITDAVAFFKKQATEMTEKEALILVQGSMQSIPFALRLIPSFLRIAHIHGSFTAIAIFLMKPAVISELDLWIEAYTCVVVTFPPEVTPQITQKLIHLCSTEVNDGHTENHVIRSIPDEPIQLCRRKGPVSVKEWRKIAKMFDALAKTPGISSFRLQILSIIKASLKVFTFPLVQTISQLINAIRPVSDDTFQLFEWMLDENSYIQIAFLKIVPLIIKKMRQRDFVKRFVPRIIEFSNDKRISSRKCSAIIALGSLTPIRPFLIELGLFTRALDAIKAAETDEDVAVRDTFVSHKEEFGKLETAHCSPIKEENVEPPMNEVVPPDTSRKLKKTNPLAKNPKSRKASLSNIIKPSASVSKLPFFFRPSL